MKVTLGRFKHGLALRRRKPAADVPPAWEARGGIAAGAVPTAKGRRVGGVRWRSVLALGGLVGAATVLLGRFVIFLYIFAPMMVHRQVGAVSPEQAEAFGFFVGRYAMPAFFFVATVAAALWLGRRIGPGARLHGLLVGLTAFLAAQAVGFTYAPGLILWEMIVYPALAVTGGLLGGRRGWSVRAGEEALHEASRDVASARSARAVAAAIGERLAGTDVVGVSVWEATDANDAGAHGFELAGCWGASGGSERRAPRPWPPGSRLDDARVPALRGLFEAGVRAFDVAELPPEGRGVWEERGTKAVLLVPLSGLGEAWAGLLAVESRRGFPPAARRAYATVGAQAAPALENLHLVEEARRAGLLGERKRLAGEIHDTLAQDFTSIVTNLEAAEAALGSREPLGAARGLEHLDRARAIAREGLTEARRLVRALKPRLLEDTALPEALSRLARGWSEGSGVAATCTTTGPVRPLPPEIESALFRAAQEALTNVAKHAGASRVAITLSYVGERVVLDVLDDGAGFDLAGAAGAVRSADAVGGFGLAGMRERAEALGGTLTVESVPGEGTTLAVDLPGVPVERAGAPA